MALAALAVGVGLGVAIAPNPTRMASPIEGRTPIGVGSANADELARWKDEILSELHRLRDTPQSSEAAAVQRAPVVPAQDEINRRLSEIEHRLDALASGTPAYQRSKAWRNARGSGFPSVEATKDFLRDADQHGRLTEAREELVRRFYLWTPDETVAAFGPPTSVGAQHGVDFSYGTFDLKDGTCTLWFSFQADLISEVWFDCKDRK
jgi:hypothetical protein